MTNTDMASAPAPESTSIITVPVVKSKSTVQIDTAAVPEDIYAEAMKEGFKVLVNGGAHKITPANLPDESERMAEAQKLAESRVELMYEGKLKVRQARAASKSDGKYDAKTITEARRIGRDMVKKAIKAKGQKISGYTSSEITALANSLIDLANPESAAIYAQAEKNLAVRNNDPSVSIDTVALKSDADVAKVAKAKADKVKPAMSKTQAGITEHRATH